MSVRITEREVAAELASELDALLESGGYPFQRATVEASVGVGFPDLVLWEDYAARRAFASWELKAPGLREDIGKLPTKAQALGVRYVVVWNFQSGTLYELANGALTPLKNYPSPLLTRLEDWRIVPKRQQVIIQAQKILDDLARLHQQGHLRAFVPDKIYFIAILQQAVAALTPLLEQRLLAQRGNRALQTELLQWARKQGIATDIVDLYPVIAQQWAYSIALRILFYFTVRRHFPALPDLKPPPDNPQYTIGLLKQAFSQAQRVDWQAVFENDLLDRIGLPDAANQTLADLLTSFQQYDFGLLQEDVIGEILEGLIPPEERHALGQYFTREDLVDFIVGFVADQHDAAYLDPTCGSGTFLIRLYSRLRWLSQYRARHADLLGQIWGVDIAKFPAELATINLFRQNVQDISNFPRVETRDFFDITPNQTFEFPPPRAVAPDYAKVSVPMPTFWGIVGNFPYIRQELIEKVARGYKREITHAIAQQWFWRDRELFALDGIRDKELETIAAKDEATRAKWLTTQVKQGRVDLRLSGQADIYAYLFLHAASFLQEGGRIGVVTSNAWLDVSYGLELKRFFFRHFKIIAIVASWAEPWFQDAAVNTVFTILERCEDADARDANITRFVKVKRPLAEILPQELLAQENDRWLKVDALIRQIRDADASVRDLDALARGDTSFTGVHTVENDTFRIRLVSQAELRAEVDSRSEQAKWGKYLRAPQVYFDLQHALGDKLVPLEKIAEVRFGIKTGINDFFYLKPCGRGTRPGMLKVRNGRGEEFEIEQDCLHPVITSPKEAKGILVDAEALPYLLFLPPLDLDDEKQAHNPKKLLLENGWIGAHKYVEWGEKQKTPQGVPWNKVPSVSGRKVWWLLDYKAPGAILMQMINNDRFVVFLNSDRVCVDHNLFEFIVSPKDADYIAALMNASIFALNREVGSRANLGDGATKTEGVDWKTAVPLPYPRDISDAKKKKILSAFEKLKTRAVKPIAEEVKQRDRRALDEAVLDALGLDPAVYLPQIYAGLVEMVEERLALPKMRRKQKKQTQRVSQEQVEAQVRNEILPNGVKSIESFIGKPKPKMMDISVTGRPVAWQPFINEFTLLDTNGNTVGTLTGDEIHARYAVYAAKPMEFSIAIPADSTAAGKIVQQYEQYLRETGKQLRDRALEATRNIAQAERVAREILQSFGLPPIAIEIAMK